MRHRFIRSGDFIDHLIECGILPTGTSKVTITADFQEGGPVLLDYVVLGDDRLLEIGKHIEVTDDPKDDPLP